MGVAMTKIALTSLLTVLLTACSGATVGVGVSVPIGGAGSVGVGINSQGTVNAGIGVGGSHGGVSVGTSTRLPQAAEPASAPAAPASAVPQVVPGRFVN
jgi:hypothetical protein